MKGAFKFSGRSGAGLSRRPDYPGGTPLREALDGSGELSNGERVSQNATAILEYFKRSHARHHDPGPEHADLYREAWGAIQALRAPEERPTPWDCWVWFALLEHLGRQGYSVGWMFAHAEAHCPRCGGPLRVAEGVAGHNAVECGVNCGQDSSDRTADVVEKILGVYGAGLKPIDELRFIRPTRP